MWKKSCPRPDPVLRRQNPFPLRARPVPLREIEQVRYRRVLTGIPELDRVLGGGVVPGSAVLVGGDPGIGKSTLLLQMCSTLQLDGGAILYVTGEESKEQVGMRAARLNVRNPRPVYSG